MPEKVDDFNGRLVWGSIQDYHRDHPELEDKSVWMAWEELPTAAQTYHCHIGDSLLTYFRNTESNQVLLQKLEDLEHRFNNIRSTYQKRYKETGGR
jgi:hypothetical protein